MKAMLSTLVAVGLALAVAAPAQAAKPKTTLVSRNSAGAAASLGAYTEPSSRFISEDGRFVAFYSNAPNLPGTSNTHLQVFVRDRKSKKTRIVSVTSSGAPGVAASLYPSISADGRFVAFQSAADNLPGGLQANSQVLVRDTRTKKTTLASKTSSGQAANVGSYHASISGNGRYVAFTSEASNLPAGDGTTQRVYVHDRKSKKTALVSKNSSGQAASGSMEAYGPAISNDGRFVVFYGFAANMPGASLVDQVYLHDRKTGKTKLVSKSSGGAVGTGQSLNPGISGNGRIVAFASYADNFHAGADGSIPRLFAHDLKTKKTILVSKNSAGQVASGSSHYPHPSGDGRMIAFSSVASNLPAGNGATERVYVHDRKTKKTKLVSTSGGQPGNGSDYYASISLDGRFVGFTSESTNYPGANGNSLIYMRGPL